MQHYRFKFIAAIYAMIIASPLHAEQDETSSKDKHSKEQPKKPVIMPRVDVIGAPENLEHISGSANVLDKKTLEQSRVFTVNEALRKVPGIHARDEEGLGLRPNIGIRGLNPTRSTKINLLEDGIPLAYAPYGDNASYYHPPIERFDRIEILKGADQIRFGPQTIGGVINYITPTPPQKFGGHVQAIGGNLDYFNGKVQLGGKGLLLDLMH
ncbi:MAG: TonB-dependent receptor plug domain-containing protein [Nitrosomonas sp.]|uniref:TonB-dependent receptor plug domain-containing protein n=1 Tax=Nitrosomonas sp. TaxID=42353 RepID=UPI0027309CA0|nr:TonB-dependent receptor plug domain-containing protein [Nitrosomonas sp.]MDP1551257.1 TonB-dependent receptor plug domain-containing protein [Nitrosomonas sp.]